MFPHKIPRSKAALSYYSTFTVLHRQLHLSHEGHVNVFESPISTSTDEHIRKRS